MIGVIYGTTGELIKLAPLLVALDAAGCPYATWCTGQQPEQIPGFLAQFGLRPPDRWLGRGHRGGDLSKNRHIPTWAGGVLGATLRSTSAMRRELLADGREPLIVVHGDTLTTLLGAIVGKWLRIPVAHVEAGYRSGSWRAPFPEELVRRIVSRLARLHYASGPHTADNLRRERVGGTIIDTGYNTIRDSMVLAAAADLSSGIALPDEPFGLVSLHRFELLHNATLFRDTLEILRSSAESGPPLLFVDHSVTADAIQSAGLEGMFGARLRRVSRLPYFEFIGLLRRSAFLVTDSGGSQQECWQLGHPCLIHRAVTEHTDSVGGSVVLSRFDREELRQFLFGGWRGLVGPAHALESPTAVIVSDLRRRGVVPVT